MTYTLKDFTIGDRVQLHPATDLWMRGACFGTVRKIGRAYLRVELDKLPGKHLRLCPGNIAEIVPQHIGH